jgi:hypothetical protein
MNFFVVIFVLLFLLIDLAVPFRPSSTTFTSSRSLSSAFNTHSVLVQRHFFPSHNKKFVSYAKRRRKASSSDDDYEDFSRVDPRTFSPFTKGLLTDTMRYFEDNKPDHYAKINELMVASFYGTENDTGDSLDQFLDLCPKLLDFDSARFCPASYSRSLDDPVAFSGGNWISVSVPNRRTKHNHDKLPKEANGKRQDNSQTNRRKKKPSECDKVIETQIAVN